MTPLDRAINNDVLVVSKSLLPYLNIDRQKPMAIFIKAMELIYTINLFSNEASVRSMNRGSKVGWEKSFLNDVKSNLDSDKAYFIDAILKLTEAKDLLSKPDSSTVDNQKSEYHLHPLDSGILESMPFPEPDIPSTPPHEKTSSNARPNTKFSGPSPEQIINGLSSILDPDQAQLLKVLTSLFTTNNK